MVVGGSARETIASTQCILDESSIRRAIGLAFHSGTLTNPSTALDAFIGVAFGVPPTVVAPASAAVESLARRADHNRIPVRRDEIVTRTVVSYQCMVIAAWTAHAEMRIEHFIRRTGFSRVVTAAGSAERA